MKRKKGPKVPKVRVFFIVHLFIYYYEAQQGPQQPTMANAGPRRRKRAQTTIGMCFLCTIILFYFYNESSSRKSFFLLLQSPGSPTAANDGQRRPTKTKKGPNDARRIVWAINIILFIFTTSRHPVDYFFKSDCILP